MNITHAQYATEQQTHVETVIDGQTYTIPCDAGNRHWAAIVASGIEVGPYVAPAPSAESYAAAIQAHIDTTAKSKGYADGVACASYITSTIPGWQAEAAAFVPWRDSVWLAAYLILGQVQAGQRSAPTIESLIAEMPVITWPGA